VGLNPRLLAGVLKTVELHVLNFQGMKEMNGGLGNMGGTVKFEITFIVINGLHYS
jgi:hypothetical protein